MGEVIALGLLLVFLTVASKVSSSGFNKKLKQYKTEVVQKDKPSNN